MALPNSIAKSDLATLLGLTTTQLNNVRELTVIADDLGNAIQLRVVTFRDWVGDAGERNIPKRITLT